MPFNLAKDLDENTIYYLTVEHSVGSVRFPIGSVVVNGSGGDGGKDTNTVTINSYPISPSAIIEVRKSEPVKMVDSDQ